VRLVSSGEAIHTVTNPGSVEREPAEGGDIVYPSAIPFVLVHLTCIAAKRSPRYEGFFAEVVH
jgi:hypothetical protein